MTGLAGRSERATPQTRPARDTDEDAAPDRGRRVRLILGPVLSVVLLTAALYILHGELRLFHPHDVWRRLQQVPTAHLVAALVLTCLSYATLTGYDTLGFRYIGHPLPYRRIAFASFISYVFSHNIGLSSFGGTAVRYRIFSGWGLSTIEIMKIVVFVLLTFWLGYFSLAGVALLLEPTALQAVVPLPAAGLRLLGAVMTLPVGAYIVLAIRGRTLRIRGLEMPLPRTGLALCQILVSTADWMLAASVLYLLLPTHPGLDYIHFTGLFLLSTLIAMISNVPAGLGVLETAMVLVLKPYTPADVVLATLLAYRLIYYLLPLVLGAGLLASHELVRRPEAVARVQAIAGRWIPALVPPVLATTVFTGGAILLFSGATPALHGRMEWLKDFLPLPVIEVSHFIGSLTGMALLILARGIQRRVDAAWVLTSLLLALGIVASLVKGLDYEEAIVLGIMLAALLPCRRYFYRKSSLLGRALSPGWLTAILFVLQGAAFLTIWSHRHLEYSNELWWRFTFSGDAPRSLRALLGAIVVLAFFGAARLLRPVAPRTGRAEAGDLNRALAIVRGSPDSTAALAMLGDKTLLFSDSGLGFIMYGIEGRSWVSMGDPAGPSEETRELVWSFRELVDRHDGWTVFYEAGPGNIPLFLDLGLSMLKLGEQGRVPLADFTLDGSERKHLRQTVRRMEKEGGEFSLVPAGEVPPLVGRLREISDDWLRAKGGREKGFSLGFFDEDYLALWPLALVRQNGRIVGFANVWASGESEELSIDLMRYTSEAPPSAMEYLFIELMLWGRERGYRWFNLGMAPLSGIEDRALAPLWSRLASLLYRHGENFYNFEGLRRYKEKFDPVWEPRYLASPGGLALPLIVANLATLVSRGPHPTGKRR